MTLYIPSKKLRALALIVAGIAAASLVLVLMRYQLSGTVVAQSALATPIAVKPLSKQMAVAYAESAMRNTMREMGLPTVNVDKVEWITLVFQPVRLSPELGEVTLQLKLVKSGFSANPETGGGESIGKTIYHMIDNRTGKSVFKTGSGDTKYDYAHHDGVIGIDHTGRKTRPTWETGSAFSVAGRFTPPETSDYVLTARIEKLQYAHPIKDATLIVKTGMAPEPSLPLILSLVGAIALGLFLFIITTPPELRKKKPR